MLRAAEGGTNVSHPEDGDAHGCRRQKHPQLARRTVAGDGLPIHKIRLVEAGQGPASQGEDRDHDRLDDGIGLSIAVELAREGVKVFVAGRTQPKIDEALKIVRRAGDA